MQHGRDNDQYTNDKKKRSRFTDCRSDDGAEALRRRKINLARGHLRILNESRALRWCLFHLLWEECIIRNYKSRIRL